MGLLHEAAKAGDVEHVKTLLEHGYKLEERDIMGWTPLHYAAAFGHLRVVQLLLDRGAHVDARDRRGLTPLYHAVKEGNFEVAELLLLRGADPRVRDKRGWSPIHHAVKGARLRLDQLFVGEPAPLRFVKLLLERGVDPNEQTREGWTPLHIAARYNRLFLAELLLDAGANPNIPDKRGWTPLHYAFRHGWMELAHLLLERGADPSARDRRERTPLELRRAGLLPQRWERPFNLGKLLTREAVYRSRREVEVLRAPGGGVITIMWAIIISVLSLLAGLFLAYFPEPRSELAVLLAFFFLSLLPGLTQMALNVNVIISDKLVDPLRHLPIDWRELYSALTMQSFLSGGFLPLFAFIPAALTYLLLRRSIILPLAYTVTGVFTTLLVISLGYLLGSLGSGYTRSVLRRAASTLVWVLALSAGYFGNLLSRVVEQVLLLEGTWVRLIPPISFLYVTRDPFSLASSVASFAALAWLNRLSVAKFVSAALPAELYAPRTAPSWSLNAWLLTPVAKELKVILRSPRILATIIANALIPSIFVAQSIPTLQHMMQELQRNVWWFFDYERYVVGVVSLLMVLLGVFQASQASYFTFVIEAANAKILYLLPLTRLEVALVKSLTFLVLYSPFLVAISVGGALFVSPIVGLAYASAVIGSALLSSLLLAAWAPRNPSHWSRETYDPIGFAFVWLGIISPLLLPFLLLLLTLLAPALCGIVQLFFSLGPLNFALAYLLALYAGCALLAARLRRDPV